MTSPDPQGYWLPVDGVCDTGRVDELDAWERRETAGRIGLARSILAHAEGHERRAVREALAALDGASVDEIARARDEDG